MEKLAQQNHCVADSTASSLAKAAQMELEFIQRVLLGPQRGNLTAIECLFAQDFRQNSSMMPNYGAAWKNSEMPKLEMEKHTNRICGVDEPKSDNESETDRGDQKLKRRGVGRPKRNPSECKVCGRKSMYCYYRIRCCEGCKQFFRRAVAKRTLFNCFGAKNCHIGKDGIRCRGCRLDKCLLVGMDPTLINAMQQEGKAQYLDRLELRKKSALLRENCREEKNLLM
ncbi:hypothetical protein niasHS_009871 [Heterodera schachtii]|uniref:Nuclear receptor domain-containing protein n=1 Tax=Heterodera schachtii TaxID=97005 RepID=A0ABD2JCW1_HETSC